MKQNPKILLSEHFDTLNKMCAYHKHLDFAYYFIYIDISKKPQVTICTLFVVNFVFFSVTFVEISYFLKIGGDNSQM